MAIEFGEPEKKARLIEIKKLFKHICVDAIKKTKVYKRSRYKS